MKRRKSGLARVTAWIRGIGVNIPTTAQAAFRATTPQLKKVCLSVTACGCGDCNDVPSGQRGNGD